MEHAKHPLRRCAVYTEPFVWKWQFPSASQNALIPLAWLEAARRPTGDQGGAGVIGVDVAGPGKSLEQDLDSRRKLRPVEESTKSLKGPGSWANREKLLKIALVVCIGAFYGTLRRR